MVTRLFKTRITAGDVKKKSEDREGSSVVAIECRTHNRKAHFLLRTIDKQFILWIFLYFYVRLKIEHLVFHLDIDVLSRVIDCFKYNLLSRFIEYLFTFTLLLTGKIL